MYKMMLMCLIVMAVSPVYAEDTLSRPAVPAHAPHFLVASFGLMMSTCVSPVRAEEVVECARCGDCQGAKHVRIPKSVTTIGYGAFFLGGELVSVEMHEGVTSIGFLAFFRTYWDKYVC